MSVTALLAGEHFEAFTIDITSRAFEQSTLSRLPLIAPFGDPLFEDLPRVPVVPIENHLSDKVCALYELHGVSRTPSTRYRDLADIVRIVRDLEIDASVLAGVLAQERRRRNTHLPPELVLPAPVWAVNFPRAARGYAEYPAEFVPVEAALTYAGRCLNEVLRGARSAGRWNPQRQRWVDSGPLIGSSS